MAAVLLYYRSTIDLDANTALYIHNSTVDSSGDGCLGGTYGMQEGRARLLYLAIPRGSITWKLR